MALYSSSSTLYFFSFFTLPEQKNQTQVMNEENTRASGSSCGNAERKDVSWDIKSKY